MIVSSVSYICLLISPALGFQRISNDSDFPFWHISRYFFPPCLCQITNPSPVRQILRWLRVCQLNSLIFFSDSNSHQFAPCTNIRSNEMGVMGWNWIWCPWDTACPSSTCHEPQCVQWCPECFHLWKWWLYSPYMADHLWQGSQSLGVVHVEYLVQDK